jgi:hypothetical protein
LKGLIQHKDGHQPDKRHSHRFIDGFIFAKLNQLIREENPNQDQAKQGKHTSLMNRVKEE